MWSVLCVPLLYTLGLGTPTANQHIFDLEKVTGFSCAPGGVRTCLSINHLIIYHRAGRRRGGRCAQKACWVQKEKEATGEIKVPCMGTFMLAPVSLTVLIFVLKLSCSYPYRTLLDALVLWATQVQATLPWGKRNPLSPNKSCTGFEFDQRPYGLYTTAFGFALTL